METIIIAMLKLGIKIEFNTVLKKIEESEGLTIRFEWKVSQDYVKYKKSCEWKCFETEEQMIAAFKAISNVILQEVQNLLSEKNSIA